MNTRGVLIAATAWLLAAAGPVQAGTERLPVVAELFTSQGCASCPPADALLAELATRRGVIALSFHVDYWNYLGWKDPFAAREFTERQKRYRQSLGLHYAYTPQMVIDGQAEGVGSQRETMLRLVAEARVEADAKVPVALSVAEGGALALTIGAAQRAVECEVWLLAVDREKTTDVERGENSGRTLTNTNVVRAVARIGPWYGDSARLSLPALTRPEGGAPDGYAVLIQSTGSARILGAALLWLEPPAR